MPEIPRPRLAASREKATDALMKAVDSAIATPQPMIDKYIERVRRTRPDATPAETISALKKYYLSTVSTSGAASGATAIAPTGVSIAAAGLDTVGFLAASSLYVLALAQIHGVKIDDLERRRTLILATLLGDTGSKTVLGKVAPRLGSHWGKLVVDAIPSQSLKPINKVLGQHFVTKYGTKQGILVLGKQLPLGIGAAVGAGGNAAFGYGVLKAADRAFGKAPADWHASPAQTVTITAEPA